MGREQVLAIAAVLVALSGCTLVGFGPPPMGGAGANYENYLADDTETIIVELDHSPGAGWDTTTPAEQQFVEEIERITTKDVEVRYASDLPQKGEEYAYSLTEIRDLHAQHRDHQPGDGTEVMHALFLDGKIADGVLGVAFQPRAFALFQGEIQENTCENGASVCTMPCPEEEPVCLEGTQPTIERWRLTRAVAIHEAGHLLGLVNNPLPMVEDHEMDRDPVPETEAWENRSHSKNTESVMYWALEHDPTVEDLLEDGDVPWRFDADDVRDARAAQDT